MTCPNCQAQLADGSRFCGACGKSATATERTSDPGATAAASVPLDMVGREIAGRYRVVAKLGEGGMGAVFRAEQISLKRAVAIKLLRPEMSNNAMLVRRFNAEAELVAKLSHPNTVNIYDFGQDTDGALFIAMELIEGQSLRHLLRDVGPLPPPRALAIAAQLASSLADAHAHGIIHRDLKPDNVMLSERGKERDIVRVLDFGIAKLRDDSRATQPQMTQAGDMLGTPQYMAPEQIRGEPIDGRTDIYALGCLLYEMLTARMPFEAPTVVAMLSKHLMEPVMPPAQRRPDLGLSPALDELVLVALEKAPAARPVSMEGYGDRIGAVLRSYQPVDSGVRHSGLAPRAAGPIAPMGYAGFDGPIPLPPEPLPPPPPPPPSIPLGYAGLGVSGQSSGGLAASRAAAGPTEMVDPLPRPALMRGPNGVMMTTTLPPPSGKKGHGLALVLVLVAVGVLGAAGVGIGVYVSRQGKAVAAETKDTKDTKDPENAKDAKGAKETKEPEDPKAPGRADPGKADPWAHAADDDDDAPAPAPDRGALPTAATPVPAGARIDPPFGATRVDDIVGGQHYVDVAHRTDYYLAPLFAGTNDPNALAQMWISNHPGVQLVRVDHLVSAGATRDALVFSGTLQTPTGPVLFTQLGVLYITPSYRVGVIVQAPLAAFGNDPTFGNQLEAFFKAGVTMP